MIVKIYENIKKFSNFFLKVININFKLELPNREHFKGNNILFFLFKNFYINLKIYYFNLFHSI